MLQLRRGLLDARRQGVVGHGGSAGRGCRVWLHGKGQAQTTRVEGLCPAAGIRLSAWEPAPQSGAGAAHVYSVLNRIRTGVAAVKGRDIIRLWTFVHYTNH